MTPDPIAISPDKPKQTTHTAERQSSSWDIKNAPKNYIWLVVFQLGSAIFSFGAVWLITRNLGSTGYGGIVAVIAASQVAQILVNWTSVAVVRFGVDEFIDTQKIARIFWVRLIILLANLVLVLSLSSLWFQPLADWLKLTPDAFWLVILHFTVTAFWIHIQVSLQGVKMPREQGFLQMMERMTILIGFLVLIGLGRLDFFWVIVCYISAPAAMLLIGLTRLRTFILSSFSVDAEFIKKVILYSAPLAPMVLIGYFSGSYLDAIFVTNFLSTTDLGIYSVATQMNGIVLQLPTLANSLLIPLFVTLNSEGSGGRINAYFKHTLPFLTLVWGLLCIAASVIGYFLIPQVFGPEFFGSAVPFWILITSSVVGLPVLFGYAAVTHSSLSTYIAAIASIFSAVVNVVFNIVLIPRFGIEGCAWATVLAYFSSTIVFAVLLRKRVKIPISWVFVAIIPNTAGAIIFSFYSNLYLAAFAGVFLTIMLGLYKWRSVEESLNIVRRLAKI